MKQCAFKAYLGLGEGQLCFTELYVGYTAECILLPADIEGLPGKLDSLAFKIYLVNGVLLPLPLGLYQGFLHQFHI